MDSVVQSADASTSMVNLSVPYSSGGLMTTLSNSWSYSSILAEPMYMTLHSTAVEDDTECYFTEAFK